MSAHDELNVHAAGYVLGTLDLWRHELVHGRCVCPERFARECEWLRIQTAHRRNSLRGWPFLHGQ